MTKQVEITINIEAAKILLRVAGYDKQVQEYNDDQIFDLAVNQLDSYGLEEYKILDGKNN